jgi:hypothetical protein
MTYLLSFDLATTTSTAGTVAYNPTLTINTTGAWTTSFSVGAHQIKSRRYNVRCRSCARWAKIVKMHSRWDITVDCQRCLGLNKGVWW